MKAKNVLLFCLALAAALPVYIWAGTQLRALRTAEKTWLRMPNLPFSADFYRVAAGEFAGLSADFLYLDIAAALGGRNTKLMTSGEWEQVRKAFEVVTGLDVYFEPTFRAIQAYMTWDAKDIHDAVALLEPVSEKRVWDWNPPFFIAFDHYFFLRDNGEASRWFLQAAQREKAPPLLATLGARLAAESGNAAYGLDFLRRMMQTATTDEERETYEQRITALEGVVILEDAVARYRADYGRNPPALWALMLHGYIEAMPHNPYHPTFFYLNGIVRFDPFPTKGTLAEGRTYSDEEMNRPSLFLNKNRTPSRR